MSLAFASGPAPSLHPSGSAQGSSIVPAPLVPRVEVHAAEASRDQAAWRAGLTA